MDRRTALKLGVAGLAGVAAGTGAQAGTSVPAGSHIDGEVFFGFYPPKGDGEALGYVPDDPDYMVDGYIAGVPRHVTRCEVESMRRTRADDPPNKPPKESPQYFIPPLRFRYRPMTAKERWLPEDPRGNPISKAVKQLVERIKAWDLQCPSGDVLPISEATMLRLRPELFDRLAGIVVGCDQTSDPMPG